MKVDVRTRGKGDMMIDGDEYLACAVTLMLSLSKWSYVAQNCHFVNQSRRFPIH